MLERIAPAIRPPFQHESALRETRAMRPFSDGRIASRDDPFSIRKSSFFLDTYPIIQAIRHTQGNETLLDDTPVSTKQAQWFRAHRAASMAGILPFSLEWVGFSFEIEGESLDIRKTVLLDSAIFPENPRPSRSNGNAAALSKTRAYCIERPSPRMPFTAHFLYIRTILILYSDKALTLEGGASIVGLATSKESAMRNRTAHITVSPAVCGVENRFPFMFNLTPLDARINCGHRHFGTVSHAYSYRYL